MYATDHITKKWFKKQLEPNSKANLSKSVNLNYKNKTAAITHNNYKTLNQSKNQDKNVLKSSILSSAMHSI